MSIKDCLYVCSRGLMQSCSIFTTPIVSSNNKININILTNLVDGDSLYICADSIENFICNVLPKLTKRVVLVSGDGDYMIRNIEIYKPILESPYIIKWFAQNLLFAHEKLIHLPIGFGYHAYYDGKRWDSNPNILQNEAAIINITKHMKPFYDRKISCYTTFHFQLHRGDRREAKNNIPSKLVYYEPNNISQLESYKHQIEYAFVISPYGGGYDCHRTWEALAMGCIPIIKTSGLDPLFNDLPVLIISKWSDLTQELLNETVNSFKDRTFDLNKLTLKYWVDKIESYKTK